MAIFGSGRFSCWNLFQVFNYRVNFEYFNCLFSSYSVFSCGSSEILFYESIISMGRLQGRRKCVEDGTCCNRTFVCGLFVIFLSAWTMLKLHTFHSLSNFSTFLILKQNLNGVTYVTVYCILVGFLCDMLHKIWIRELLKHVCGKFSGDNYVESSLWELCLS
jgi:hypothetical protein